ncbi:hypothetical protein DPEC_G00134840 [Dallia pectoralis]|uniref:Uncharacterized protein n=1 Tax=Dallia pectoralis TaxID=75939 RepID=A0ACC2GRW1_DALPE|nr:hypothetical protein DPEC_G00134840 [Dallia pectoralis]
MFAQEKPFFINSRIRPGTSKSFVLSQSGVAVPFTISRYLRGYQQEGIQFIYDNYAQSKVVSWATTWAWAKLSRSSLIVAPLSVLYNWKDELETWGHFRSVVWTRPQDQNPNSQITVAMKELRCRVRVGLTGTHPAEQLGGTLVCHGLVG